MSSAFIGGNNEGRRILEFCLRLSAFICGFI